MATGGLIALVVAAGIYLAAPVFSLLYLLVLLPRDVRYVGRVCWFAYRFELVSTKSRYARWWKSWKGCGLWGFMITNDAAPSTVAHEAMHCWRWLQLGGYHGIAYGAHWLWLELRGRDGYRENYFEREAVAASERALQNRSA